MTCRFCFYCDDKGWVLIAAPGPLPLGDSGPMVRQTCPSCWGVSAEAAAAQKKSCCDGPVPVDSEDHP